MPEAAVSAGRMNAGDRRRQLLETALDLFSRKGYSGITTKEIAAAAGVTEAIIFRHFPSKQALYTAVLDSKTEDCGHEEWLADIQAHMDRNDDAGVLRILAAAVLASYRVDARFERIFLFAALEGHELGLAHHRRFALPVFELFRDYIARRQREGALRDYDPGLIIAAIAGMAQNYAIYTEFFGFTSLRVDDAEVVDTFTNIMMRGIRQSKGANKAPRKAPSKAPNKARNRK
jgi:TetR/AcrR family transcriptional regulator